MWKLDKATYGFPDYGMKWGTSREFTTSIGDRGRNRNIDYNATAPQPVEVVYGWRGATLATFREAWENADGLAYGSVWFDIELEDGTYRAHFSKPFQASLAAHDWWKVSMQLDVDPSPPLFFAIAPSIATKPILTIGGYPPLIETRPTLTIEARSP